MERKPSSRPLLAPRPSFARSLEDSDHPATHGRLDCDSLVDETMSRAQSYLDDLYGVTNLRSPQRLRLASRRLLLVDQRGWPPSRSVDLPHPLFVSQLVPQRPRCGFLFVLGREPRTDRVREPEPPRADVVVHGREREPHPGWSNAIPTGRTSALDRDGSGFQRRGA